MVEGVVQAAAHVVAERVAGDAHDEQIVGAFVEDQFDRNARVGAAEDRGKGSLLQRIRAGRQQAQIARIDRDDSTRRPGAFIEIGEEFRKGPVAVVQPQLRRIGVAGPLARRWLRRRRSGRRSRLSSCECGRSIGDPEEASPTAQRLARAPTGATLLASSGLMLETASKCDRCTFPVSSCRKCDRFSRSITGPFTADRCKRDTAFREPLVDRRRGFRAPTGRSYSPQGIRG